ncbi:MAG: peptide ABC transporter ATP-binding protein, partial [Dehalococcoidia bacterium]|nr:peptide ABC transporter ATP-binding protein [Dehalococcoidia bacterium]
RHGRDQRLHSIGGQPPLLMADPAFCPFQARCANAFERCLCENPPLERVAPGHDVACWLERPQEGRAA